MEDTKSPFSEGNQKNQPPSQKKKVKNSSTKKKPSKNTNSNDSDQEVLFKLPGGFKYKLPGKRQRVFLGSLVIGLNLLLLIAIVIYFYSPSFQEFIYNFARD